MTAWAEGKPVAVSSQPVDASLRLPLTPAWGANDPLSPLATADKLNAAIKSSRKVVFDKAGHYPFLEHADKFNNLVLEFLKAPS
jgi:pimeloyl-ACP methyl ester carboxylesterase